MFLGNHKIICIWMEVMIPRKDLRRSSCLSLRPHSQRKWSQRVSCKQQKHWRWATSTYTVRLCKGWETSWVKSFKISPVQLLANLQINRAEATVASHDKEYRLCKISPQNKKQTKKQKPDKEVNLLLELWHCIIKFPVFN